MEYYYPAKYAALIIVTIEDVHSLYPPSLIALRLHFERKIDVNHRVRMVKIISSLLRTEVNYVLNSLAFDHDQLEFSCFRLIPNSEATVN